MIETVTAVMGLVSAGIFLAHAFEDIAAFKQSLFRSLPRIRSSIETGRCIMRNHDLVSGGFLAVTAAGLVLLCSSLLAFAFV